MSRGRPAAPPRTRTRNKCWVWKPAEISGPPVAAAKAASADLMLLPQSHPAPRARELWAFAKGTRSCAADPWQNQTPGRSNLGLEQKGLLSQFLWGCHSFTQKRFPSFCSAPGAGTARSQGTHPCPTGACSRRGEWWAGRTRTLAGPGRDSWGLSWLSKGWPWTQSTVFVLLVSLNMPIGSQCGPTG